MTRRNPNNPKLFVATLFTLVLLLGVANSELAEPPKHIFLDPRFAFQPEFTEPIHNLTVANGRDAVFRCHVRHLGGYRVGWVKADTKAIQAIHDHVITHNPRVSVTHTDHNTWNLHIKGALKEDAGAYMCQINTDPMISQMGTLYIVTSPDFIENETSGDVMVTEGGTVTVFCRAAGEPSPRIQWKREDNGDIMIRENNKPTNIVPLYQGEVLRLTKISRHDMGAYLCIASNGVPPSISKRIMIIVNFHPIISVPNQLVGAPLGTNVTLECVIESSPKSITYWMRDNEETPGASGDMLVNSPKYTLTESSFKLFEMRMTIVIKNMQKQDVGSYKCFAKNSLGDVESSVRVYDIAGPTKTPGIPLEDEDYDGQFGSAEREQDEELSNNVVIRGRGQSRATADTPQGKHENHVPVDPATNCSSCLLLTLFSLVLLLFNI